jgi:hypothetical protein
MLIGAGKNEKMLTDIIEEWNELKNHRAKLSSSRLYEYGYLH